MMRFLRWPPVWVLLITTFFYFPVVQNGFVLNDSNLIVGWELIKDLGNFPRFWIGFIPPEGDPSYYSPLKTFFYALTHLCFGSSPLGYHLFILALHLLATFLVYRLSFLLFNNTKIALGIALLFGIHPVHVESVAFISGGMEILGAIFFFLGLYDYLISATSPAAVVREENYCRALLWSFLAIFTSETTLALPFLFLLSEIIFYHRSFSKNAWLKALQRALPFFFLVLFYLLLKWLVVGNMGQPLMGSFYLHMMLMIKAWAKYFWLMIFPFTLTVNHQLAPGIFSFQAQDFDSYAVLSQSLLEPVTLVSLLILVGLGGGVVILARRHSLLVFGFFWFYLALLPHVFFSNGIYFAERYLYISSLAFCMLVGVGADRLIKWIQENNKVGGLKIFAIISGISILAFYGIKVQLRIHDWKNPVTLYESAVKTTPESAALQGALGAAYLDQGGFDHAVEHLEKAVSMSPQDEHLYLVLAEGYGYQGKLEEAIQAL
ncbi:MAG: tetratricopeptide repeat protein, partial [Candidatus Omnitrophica bacterium]|nr:tetratricopeptide repeat protein [Candidatus Omnitrophota bacterium]